MTILTKKQVVSLTILKTLADKYGVKSVSIHVMRYAKQHMNKETNDKITLAESLDKLFKLRQEGIK